MSKKMKKKKSPQHSYFRLPGRGEREAVMQQPCHRACGPEKQAVSIETHRGRGQGSAENNLYEL